MGDECSPFIVLAVALCLLLVCVIILGMADIVLINDVPFIQNQTEFTKIGYVTDIEFIGGGFGSPPEQTIVRFSDGDVVTFQYWETEIPKQQNVTLCYHDNGYGKYFLDGFTVLEEKK